MPSQSNIPRQQQQYPGSTEQMTPKPQDEMEHYVGSGKLQGKAALISGGDSGIGRAVAIAFAKEGADVAIGYLSEDEDARYTAKLIEQNNRKAVLFEGDLSQESHCQQFVKQTVSELGRLDIVVNNIAYQNPVERPEEITSEQWLHTFDVNIHSYFWTTQAALPHLQAGTSIINTSSINGLRGNNHLIDYSATKGAILAWTYSMAQALMQRQIRVNAVAPGPVWTPLIPSTMPPEKVEGFGEQAPMERVAQPDEIAPTYVFLASNEMSSYYSGQVFAPVGGEVVPG